jgi:hypothetical protein
MLIKLSYLFLAFTIQALWAPPSRAGAVEPISFSSPSFSGDASIPDLSLFEKYLSHPSDQIKLAKYLLILPSLLKDRSQTLQLERHGFEENNPLLGRRPSTAKINGYFLMYALSLFAAFHLPEPFASSLLDSVRFQEEIVAYENERLFDREVRVDAAPIAFMFTILY